VAGARAADEPPAEADLFRSNTAEVLQGAATLAGAGCPGGHGTPMVLGLLLQGDRLHLWKLEESDRALELSHRLLARVKDSTGLRVDDSALEPEAYCEALLKSSLVSLGAFANSARTDVTFAQLFNEPWRYRGQVIHFEGKLRRITRLDPPAIVEPKGIRDLYECWFFDTRYGVNPVCLVCTELPRGVEPGDKLDLTAGFDAYFFKRYRYKSADSKPDTAREAPLFIGRSFVVKGRATPPAAEDSLSGAKTGLVIFLGAVLATFVLVFALHWWFRRADRRVQARIKEVRTRQYADPESPGRPGATPSAN
jgi:hypothetical protein